MSSSPWSRSPSREDSS